MLPELEPIVKLEGVRVKYGVAPDCVTETYCVDTPVPVIVTVADRELVDVFSLVAVTVIVLLFEPLDGATVNHDALSDILQLVFELMLN